MEPSAVPLPEDRHSAPLPPRAGPRIRLRERVAALAIPFLVYLAGLHYVGSGDTQPAELLPISILEHGTLEFRPFVRPEEPLPYWFHRVGPRVVSSYPLLPGLLNVPVYAAARILGVPLLEHRDALSLLTTSAVAALSVLFLFLALLELGMSRATSIGMSSAYAFGTCLWSVASRGLWQHGPSVLFLSAALWLICRRSDRTLALSGTLLALAVLSRPSTLLLAIPLAAVAARRRPDRCAWAWLVFAAAVPVSLHLWYSEVYLGTLLSTGTWIPFPEIANFSGNFGKGIAGLLVSPSRGLLVFSPYVLLSIAGIPRGLRSADRRLLTMAMTTGIAATILLYSFWSVWWAGHSFGYRFLIELTPFLTILAAFWWEEKHSRIARTGFGLLVGWSIYVQFLGANFQPSGFNELLDRDPRVLWSLRDSEIAISTGKLLEALR